MLFWSSNSGRRGYANSSVAGFAISPSSARVQGRSLVTSIERVLQGVQNTG